MRRVRVGTVELGNDCPLALIAGPCQIESEAHTRSIAGRLAEIAGSVGIGLIFKASFDKANRTAVDSPRGVGLEEGLAILSRIRGDYGLPVTTDVHLPEQCRAAAEAVDLLQIPAFLCRQTDLLLAAGRTGLPVNIKKGQFLAPDDMAHAASKVAAGGSEAVVLTERGNFFGYHALVADMTGLEVMKSTGHPVVMDATHAVQSPGGAAGRSGGNRRMAPVLARAAVAVGVAAVFLETHEAPERAPSDAASMLPLSWLPDLLTELTAIDRIAKARRSSF
ncbi:MAG: 3-deoxy-8-phosphooctulonate synthase [Alphaproteobacteria bacterium]|nr:MAG: 3-deoxy-8-phosphooctulonate synthase [Alphaproteobacteria bacterium]